MTSIAASDAGLAAVLTRPPEFTSSLLPDMTTGGSLLHLYYWQHALSKSWNIAVFKISHCHTSGGCGKLVTAATESLAGQGRAWPHLCCHPHQNSLTTSLQWGPISPIPPPTPILTITVPNILLAEKHIVAEVIAKFVRGHCPANVSHPPIHQNLVIDGGRNIYGRGRHGGCCWGCHFHYCYPIY